jgi:hypothetical protein
MANATPKQAKEMRGPIPATTIIWPPAATRMKKGFRQRRETLPGNHVVWYHEGEEIVMSTFNETITLTNAGDIAKARDGCIPKTEIRSITLESCVDTAVWTLVINEETRQKLGLTLESSVFSTLADGTVKEYALTEGVKLRWKNREHTLPACLVPTADTVLFGALPMEALDVYADPVDECLKGRHGDKQVYLLK